LSELFKLTRSLDRETVTYLKNRRISAKTASAMKLCCVSDYRAVAEALMDKFTKDQLIDSGIFNEKGNLRFYQHKLLLLIIRTVTGRSSGRAIDVYKELNLGWIHVLQPRSTAPSFILKL
jgi:hypothetical protein